MAAAAAAAAAVPVTTTSPRQLSVLFWNIANAKADNSPESCANGFDFPSRFPHIIRILQEQAPSVACLIEVRTCPGLSVQVIIARICEATGMQVALQVSVNPTEDAMWRVILYDPKVVYPLRTSAPWCSETPFRPSGGFRDPSRPHAIGVRAAIVEFGIRASSDPRDPKLIELKEFKVVAMHAPVERQARMQMAEWMERSLHLHTSWDGPREIIGGDFNTFMDDGGAEQLAIMASGRDWCTSKVKETFMTFPHDPYVKINGGKLHRSCLDHVFQTGYEPFLVERVDVIRTDKTPRASDHYALVAYLN